MSDNDTSTGGTYRDPCPKCGARLVAMPKEEYVEHLRENGEAVAAEIEEKLVVDRRGDKNAQT